MNKKLFKIAICGIPVALGCITACSALSCGSSSEEELSISYTDGASKVFEELSGNESDSRSKRSSVGTINADFSFADATWYFDVTCTSDASLTAQWTKFLSISVNSDDKKIWLTGKNELRDDQIIQENFLFSLYAKIGQKQSNAISGFTVTWHC